ncbi:hypothetical protein [Derxia gummosa]|uniref:Uncharacterized protein n=1 Tax=Derxia gummosa DSM 723 TaxID=1121388 RepID=A0A8B6XC45_9BURK|nr:hypothetical protein [Derxia gummosa]
MQRIAATVRPDERMRRRIDFMTIASGPLLALVIAVCLALAGCGGGGDPPAATATATTADARATAQLSATERGSWSTPAAASPLYEVAIGWPRGNDLPVHRYENVWMNDLDYADGGKAIASWWYRFADWPVWHGSDPPLIPDGVWRAGTGQAWSPFWRTGGTNDPAGSAVGGSFIAGDGVPVSRQIGEWSGNCGVVLGPPEGDPCVLYFGIRPLTGSASNWSRLLVTGAVQASARPVLRPDGSGVAVWLQAPDTSGAALLRTATRTNRTAAWQIDPDALPPLGDLALDTSSGAPLLADCGDRKMILAGISSATLAGQSRSALWVRFRDRTRSLWHPHLRVAQAPSSLLFIRDLTLVVDDGGKPHLAWVGRDGLIHHQVFDCDARALEQEELLSLPGGTTDETDIALAALADGGIAITGETFGHGGARRSVRWRSAAGVWSAPVALPAFGLRTVAAVDRGGNLHVAWSDDRLLPDLINEQWMTQPYTATGVHARSYWRAAGLWEGPRRLSTPDAAGNPSRNITPRIAVNDDGEVAVAWLHAERRTDPAAPEQDQAWAEVRVVVAERR